MLPENNALGQILGLMGFWIYKRAHVSATNELGQAIFRSCFCLRNCLKCPTIARDSLGSPREKVVPESFLPGEADDLH
jgi:hypothetical protein